jgi:NADH:ubiquinone oxidoreductase subunit C
MIKKLLLRKEIIFTSDFTKMFQPLIVYSIEGEFFCKINKDNVKNFLFFLKYYTNTYFKQLIDLFGIDNIENYQRFEVSYNLLSVL